MPDPEATVREYPEELAAMIGFLRMADWSEEWIAEAARAVEEEGSYKVSVTIGGKS